MPIHLGWGGGFGSAVNAVQVVATWARLDDSSILQLPVDFAENELTRTRFASTLPGMASLYFTNAIKCGANSFEKYRALRSVAPRVDAMQRGAYQDTLRGEGLALCCFAGARNEYLRPLYARAEPGGVREASDFRLLIPRLLGAVSQKSLSSMSEGQLDYLSALIYQLLLNADEHGSYGSEGERINTSMRGLVVRLMRVPDTTSIIKYAGSDTALRTYLAKQAFLPKDRLTPSALKESLPDGPLQLVEISVFDTGPGLALRWLSEKVGHRSYADFDIDEESEAVKTCFQKHSTTKASQYFGQGLTMALTAMKRLDAFMTLRAGRLSLFQDFSRTDVTSFEPKSRFPHTRLAETAGTSYSICFRVK